MPVVTWSLRTDCGMELGNISAVQKECVKCCEEKKRPEWCGAVFV